MTNSTQNTTPAHTDALDAIDQHVDKVGDGLADIAKEAHAAAKGLEAEMSADDLIAMVIKDAKLMHVKTGNIFKDNQNLTGACIGAAIAVGLELVSPTGSKSSAAVAAVLSGATIMIAKPYLQVAPQTAGIAAGAAAVTAYAGMVGGRVTASYFPGNLTEED